MNGLGLGFEQSWTPFDLTKTRDCISRQQVYAYAAGSILAVQNELAEQETEVTEPKLCNMQAQLKNEGASRQQT
jgi:hypothetical protein